jgi:uncharacterized protein YndB with AHSA1/START domain
MNNTTKATMEKVFEIYIKTDPETLWKEIEDPGLAARMFQVPGDPGGNASGDGDTVESDPPRKLVRTMHAKWSPEVDAAGQTRITYEIEPVGTSCRLLIVHDQIPEGASNEIWGGWPMILSALKTHLESGQPLDTPASVRFAGA